MSSSAGFLARALLLLVAGAASLELAVALSDSAPPRTGALRLCLTHGNDQLLADSGPFRFHPRWMWEPRPRANNTDPAIAETLYRGPARTLAPGSAVRIAVIGGSFAWGLGVKPQKSWPTLLRRELRAVGHDVEVLDFSVLDFSVAQGERYYTDRVRPWRPDVVVACFGGIHESETAPGGICDDDRMECAQVRGGAAEPFSERFAAARWISAAFGPAAAFPASGRASVSGRNVRVGPIPYYGALKRLAQDVEADGARLVLLAPPVHPDELNARRGFAAYTAALRNLAIEQRVALADPQPRFFGLGIDQVFDQHHRCTALAHEHTARAITDTLIRGDLLRRRPRD